MVLILVITIPSTILSIIDITLQSISSFETTINSEVVGFKISSTPSEKSIPTKLLIVSIRYGVEKIDNVYLFLTTSKGLEYMKKKGLIRYNERIHDEMLIIGERLSLKTGLRTGDNISISYGDTEYIKNIDGIVGGLTTYTYSLIMINDEYNYTSYIEPMIKPKGVVFTELIDKFRSFIIQLDILSLLIYTPLVFIGFARIFENIKREITLFTYLGVGSRRISASLLLASITYSALLSIYGIFMGKILYDLSVFIINMFGLPIYIPGSMFSPETLMITAIYYIVISALTTIIINRRRYTSV